MQGIYVCMGDQCLRQGAELLAHRLTGLIHKYDLSEHYEVRNEYCQSICGEGPMVRIGNHRYTKVRYEDAEGVLLEAHRQRSGNKDAKG